MAFNKNYLPIMYVDGLPRNLDADISVNCSCVTAHNLVLYYIPNCVILNCLHTVTKF